MGDKNIMILRLALVLAVLCLITLILVPIGSAEFFILLFAALADGIVILFAFARIRKQN